MVMEGDELAGSELEVSFPTLDHKEQARGYHVR